MAAWLIVCMLLTGMPFSIAQAEAAGEAVLFVSPNGNDSNSGAEDEPLRTLEGARDAIRALKSGGGLPEGGVTVYLREGVYERNTAFELSDEDSGTEDAPIVYRSYPGETVRLTGGKELERESFVPVTDEDVLQRMIDEEARGKVLQVNLAELGVTDYGQISRHGYWKANDVSLVPPMELYVGGQGMTLARWPNEGTVQMGEIIDPGPTVKDADLQLRGGTFEYKYDRPRFWTQAEDIWLDGIFGYSWEWSYNKVKSIDTENKTITLEYGEMSGLLKNWYPDFHFAQNLLEELDAPGEYYIDRTRGILYLMPNAEFKNGQGEITVTMIKEPMIRTVGASYIRFEELSLEYGRDTAAVILGGSHVVIANSDISNFTNGGVLINSPGRYAYDGIEGNLDGHHHAVISSHIRHVGGTAVTLHGGDKETLAPGNNRVENTHIHDFAYYHKAYNPGVLFSGVGNQAIGNEIHDAPHPGIIVYGNDHQIEYNNIYDICKDFQDLGAIYMNAGMDPDERGTIIRYNYFHHIGENLHGVEGVYPDNMTMGLTIEGNIFYKMGNSAIKSGTGSYIYAGNNIFVDTYVPYENYEMFMSKEPGNRVDRDYMPVWLELFEQYNIFVGTPYAEKYPELLTFFEEDRYFPTTNTFENNVIYNPTLTRSNQTNEHGARDIYNLMNYSHNWVADADPGFVDLAAGDFRLKPDAEVYDRIPDFEAIPFEQIGTQGKVGASHNPDTIAVSGVYLPTPNLTMGIGKTVPLRAEVVPWNATNTEVTYSSSDESIATVDASGNVTGHLPGAAVITAVSAENPELTDESVVVVTEGDGIMHFTDFEYGGNGWLIDANHMIAEDEEGNHWYRIVNGANAQHPRLFSDYVLDYRLKTPETLPDGAVLIMYDRNGEKGSGYVRYRHSENGSSWIIYNAQWQTLKEVTVEGGFLEPNTIYDVRMAVQGSSISVYVNDELVIQGENPAHSLSGMVGFYAEGFSYLEFDDVTFSLPRVPASAIQLDRQELAMEPGERVRLTATVSPPDASDKKAVWSSGNAEVADVDDNGTVRAIKPGTAVITAESRDNPDVKTTATVTVSASPDYPILRPGNSFIDTEQWTESDAVQAAEGSVRLFGDGVYGYDGEKFGSGLIRFKAKIDDFNSGWYGFALRSDRTGDPTWVGANKGYLVVIKEDQIEFQSWKPGQTMVDIIPNTAVLAGQEHNIDIGVIEAEGGRRFVMKVNGETVLNVLDTDPANPIQAEGYLNVYNYAKEGNAIELKLIADQDPGTDPGSGPGPGQGPGSNPVGTPDTEDGDTIIVRDSDLAAWSRDGVIAIKLKPEQTGVQLSQQVVAKLEQPITLESGGLTLRFVPELLKAIAEELPENAKLVIQAVPLTEGAGPAAPSSAYSMLGAPYRLELLAVVDGEEPRYISKFPESVRLEFTIEPSNVHEEYLGVYHEKEDGEWEYIGGDYDPESRTLTAELSHFSVYAIMAYEAQFTDMAPGHWAADVVKALAAKHIVTGKSADRFDPNGTTTRAEFAALLVRALGLQGQGKPADLPFRDVKRTDWYADEIAAAYEAKLVVGRQDGSFAPNERITREEMAVMLLRAYANASGGAAPVTAAEAPKDLGAASEWAKAEIEEAIRLGLMSGYPGGEFQPKRLAARDETAQAIYNLLKLL